MSAQKRGSARVTTTNTSDKSKLTKTNINSPSLLASPKLTNRSGKLDPCGKCKKVIIDNEQNSAECELCMDWFHLECEGLDANDLKTLNKPGVHWFCSRCERAHSSLDIRLKKLESKLAEITEQAQQNSNDMPLLEKTYASVVSSIDQATKSQSTFMNSVQKQLTTIKSDLQADTRSKNLVIFAMEENENNTQAIVDSLLKQCDISFQVTSQNTFRLGQRKPNKIRPIKLMTDSESTKWEIVKAINRCKPNGVFAKLDMSKEQQEEDFRLRQELKLERQKDPTGHYKIRQGKILKVQE